MRIRQSTLIFNRQVIRLCKGILKAWEHWMDEIEYEDSSKIQENKPEGENRERKKEKESSGKILSL